MHVVASLHDGVVDVRAGNIDPGDRVGIRCGERIPIEPHLGEGLRFHRFACGDESPIGHAVVDLLSLDMLTAIFMNMAVQHEKE